MLLALLLTKLGIQKPKQTPRGAALLGGSTRTAQVAFSSCRLKLLLVLNSYEGPHLYNGHIEFITPLYFLMPPTGTCVLPIAYAYSAVLNTTELPSAI